MTAHVRAGSANPKAKTRVSGVPAAIESVVTEGAFSVENFVEAFPVLSDAAGGTIALRDAIVKLAMLGRISGHEDNAEMLRLGDLISLQTGKLDSNAQTQGGRYPFFTCSTTTLYIDSCSYDCECVLLSGNGEFHARYFYGKFDAYQRIYVIESTDKSRLDVRYLHKFLISYRGALERLSGGGVIRYIKKGHLTEAQIRVPPLAEQKRIVARVDQLMALIDHLEQKQIRKRQLGANFTKASLEALTGAESPEEFDTAWKRVVENWGVLVDRVEKVADLRRTVLELAVMGKIAQQDLSEEHASKIVRRIDDIRRKISSRPVADGDREIDAPWEIPSNWEWCHVEDIAKVCLGGTPKRDEPRFWGGSVPWISSGEVANRRISCTRETITEAGLRESNAKVYPTGTVLIAMIGEGKTRGQSALLDVEACTNQNVAGLLFE